MDQVYEVWIEIQANKKLISDSVKFREAMEKCKKAGMTGIILSVKDTSGFVLYKSSLADHYSEFDGEFAADIDYAAECFKIIRELGMKCYAAFDVFVREKIEVASMAEIAREAGVGRATVFRHYPGKLDLVIAVNSAKWKEYLDELDRKRPISSVGEIPAIDRFIFTMDCYIDMYVNHKALLQFNDNFNHFVSHSGVDGKKLKGFKDSLLSADTRFIKMY